MITDRLLISHSVKMKSKCDRVVKITADLVGQ